MIVFMPGVRYLRAEMPTATDRTSGPRERLYGLDLLRTLAIVSVIAWHLPRNVYPFPFRPATWAGVDLFFVLSGFLIGSQLLRPYSKNLRPSYVDFALRRAFRIVPAFLVVLAAYSLIPQFREVPNIRPLWRFLTFTMNFGLDGRSEGAFSHGWSLCVEEHFYLLLPIVVLWFMRKPSFARAWKLSAVIVLSGLALRAALWIHYIAPLPGFPITEYLKVIYYPTYNRLDGLLAGVVLAATRLFRPDYWTRITAHGNLLLGVAVLVLGAALWICQDMCSFWTATLGYPLLAAGFAALVAASLSKNCVLSRYRLPGTTLGATVAYSTYLTHKEVMHLVQTYLGGIISLDGWVGLSVYCFSFVLFSTLLYLVVERPFLSVRDLVLGRDLKSQMLEIGKDAPAQTLAPID